MSDSTPKAISATAEELGMRVSRAYVKRIRYLDRTALRRTKPEVESQRIQHVLSMPPTTRAKEVVEAAAAKGIKMTERYVYAIRARKAGRKPGNAGKPGRPGKPIQAITRRVRSAITGKLPAAAFGSARQSIGLTEQQLRRAISEIGLARARQILAEVEKRFGT